MNAGSERSTLKTVICRLAVLCAVACSFVLASCTTMPPEGCKSGYCPKSVAGKQYCVPC
jgi:hypothetical protein